ncbi:enoyl-CoA hydratase-related protein [Micromonospora echinospora]|uniref:enoyl-CoA hydratase-related protein n=1 Tax=Micromonospora echinospora TaxID=1877 RepID=UPI00367021A6
MDAYREITYAVADQTATISLNRPEERNGYTVRMADELAHAFDRADRDDDVRVVILTGAGEHFCAGLDLSTSELDTPDDPDAAWAEPAGRCSMRIFAMNKPVIAAIRGAAVGAGATIILPADYRLAATDARFGYVFSRRGIYAEGASAWFLPRLVGMGTALDWMVSGRAFDAAEALSAGLVHSVHEPEHLLDKAHQLARTLIATTAPVSVAVIRQMLYRMSAQDSPYPAHRLDSRLSADAVDSPDAQEGFASFRQRRSPAFPGRVSRDLPGYLPWLGE